MGPLDDKHNLDDEENNRNAEQNDAATQRVDGGDGLPSCDGFQDDGENEFLYLTSTMPVDETFLLEDAFETQLVNLVGETQAMDPYGETQVLDDLDHMDHIPPELFNEGKAEGAAVSDSEETNVTEVLCDTEVVSDHNSAEVDDGDSGGLDVVVDSFQQNKGDNVAGGTIHDI